MCYHNSQKAKTEQLAERYKVKKIKDPEKIKPVYHANAFGFRPWPVITDAEPDTLQAMQWGLIPAWARSHEEAMKLRTNTLNARIETIFEKPSFREASQTRHCLVPSTGFFEWQTLNGKKYPYFIYLKNEEIFSMAGIWETWTDKQSGEPQHTFSILTTEANPLMARIHNSKQRMPVILPKEAESEWLHKGFSETTIDAFTKPFDEKKMVAYTVSRLISEKNSDTPEVQKPYNYPEFMQTSLF
ncbi:SOS response-associated peptidase [Emticicia sp. 17c]|uniref:SOS response-associated peptidase n=1 Tax=Emticicia sp. 17c TaxID=3127704 RepID=UPI00301DFB71